MPSPLLRRNSFNRRRFIAQCGQLTALATASSGLPGRLLAGSVAPAPSSSAAARVTDQAIRRRKRKMVRALAADPSFSLARKDPKYQHAIVGARLALNTADADALEYVRRVAAFSDSFAYNGLSALFANFGETWSPALREVVRASVTQWNGFLGGGTENQACMCRCAAAIFGERFPDDKFHHGLTGRELLAEAKKFMRTFGRAVYAGSMVEYLSPIYACTTSSAWLTAAEHARDDEARLMSQAVLDWILADLAANCFEISTVAPVQREKGLLTGTYQHSYAVSNTQWILWMFFGGGNTVDDDGSFPRGREPFKGPVGLHAFSRWLPHAVLRNLGARHVQLPYSIRQARNGWQAIEPTMVNAYGKKGVNARRTPGLDDVRYHFRQAYFSDHYALGSGSFKADPDEPLTSSVLPFGAWWRSPHDNNFLLVCHPFWHVALSLEGGPPLGDEDRVGISPFQRTVQHENAAVLLYDLPDDNPYREARHRGDPKWASERPARISKEVFVHVPETVDERVEADGAFFIREGEVYIGLRPFHPGARWVSSRQKGFVRLLLPGGATAGLALEIGDRAEYGSFERFRTKIAAAKLELGRLETEKAVGYVSSRGHRLEVKSIPGTWLPESSVNGRRMDFGTWPVCESSYVSCRDRVLDVNDGTAGFTIDWRGDFPSYTYFDLRDGKRTITGRRFLRDGRIVTA